MHDLRHLLLVTGADEAGGACGKNEEILWLHG